MSIDIERFHRRAVETPSHETVGPMRELLVETLVGAGVHPRVDDAGNVLARRGPPDGDPHVVLNTHVDTVPPHVPYDREGDVVRGRGACDAKGPLAALVDAFLAAEPESGRVTLAVTPDEETVQSGAAHLRGTLDADGFVVGEPTGLDVCTAARGQFEGTVTIHGENAHAATPAAGINAVRAAGPTMDAMDAFDAERGPGEHDLLGSPTLTPTVIAGGDVHNQIPAECRITFDRRSVPPETADGFRATLEEHLREHAPTGVGVDVALAERENPFLEAFATDHDDPLVRRLRKKSGGELRPFGAATEASYFAAEAPTVVFGPGDLADEDGAVAHAEREYVRMSEVRAAADAVRGTLDALVG